MVLTTGRGAVSVPIEEWPGWCNRSTRAMEQKGVAAVESSQRSALDLMSKNMAELYRLVPLAYDDTPPHLWPIALLSLQMHLEKLAREGTVAAGSDGRWRATARAE